MELLHSKILGNGKPLIILHGFLGMLDNWKSLGAKYAEIGFQVHLVDQRNHGKSFHSPVFDYDSMVNDLYNYCEYHNIENMNLIGHSMGGKTAMFFACQHPEKVEKLLVADIGPKYYAQHHQDILAGLNALDFSKVKTRNEAEEQLSFYVPDFGTRQFLLKNLYWKNPDELAFRFNLPSLTNNVEFIGQALPEEFSFNKPVLFLKGGLSDYIKPTQEPLIKKHFPLAVFQTIENAGHWLHAENPQQFYEISSAFFTL